MREMIKMVVVLVLLSSVSGGLLAGIRSNTLERVENQILEYEKAPAIRGILSEARFRMGCAGTIGALGRNALWTLSQAGGGKGHIVILSKFTRWTRTSFRYIVKQFRYAVQHGVITGRGR